MSADFAQELRQIFAEETKPQVESLIADVLRIEQSLGRHERNDEALSSTAMRLHTIKGNAAMAGLKLISSLAHCLEDAYALLALAPAAPSSQRLTQLLLDGCDVLDAWVGEPDKASESALTAIRVRLAALSGASAEPAAVPTKPVEANEAASWQSVSALRVDLTDLDKLLDGLGEAISQQASVTALLEARQGPSQSDALRLDELQHALSDGLRAMRALVLRARLVPLSLLFGRYRRHIRDLSTARGLRVAFEERGGDIAVDKTLWDGLSEPLLHILRNAVAHGIESPNERRAAGKPQEATLQVEARLQGDRVLVRVSDDGRGMDADRLRASAAARGLNVEGLTHEQALRLALLPQVSTAQAVDDLSGRGVGLDAVAHAIERLGGQIDITSQPGRGTTFALDLPASLSLLSALIVVVDGERFALPAHYVIESISVQRADLHHLHGELTLDARTLVAAHDTGTLLSTDKSGPDSYAKRARAVIVEVLSRRHALLVDDIEGFVEIIVKPLDADYGASELLLGATILIDGSMALVLNPRSILQSQTLGRRPDLQEAR